MAHVLPKSVESLLKPDCRRAACFCKSRQHNAAKYFMRQLSLSGLISDSSCLTLFGHPWSNARTVIPSKTNQGAPRKSCGLLGHHSETSTIMGPCYFSPPTCSWTPEPTGGYRAKTKTGCGVGKTFPDFVTRPFRADDTSQARMIMEPAKGRIRSAELPRPLLFLVAWLLGGRAPGVGALQVSARRRLDRVCEG